MAETSCRLVSMCDMDGIDTVPWKVQVEIVTRRREQWDQGIYDQCWTCVEILAQTCAWIEACIWLVRSWHGLTYESSMFKWNGVVADICNVHGRSCFDSCWIVGSLSADLSANQVQ